MRTSFVVPYRKVLRNLGVLERDDGVHWTDPDLRVMREPAGQSVFAMSLPTILEAHEAERVQLIFFELDHRDCLPGNIAPTMSIMLQQAYFKALVGACLLLMLRPTSCAQVGSNEILVRFLGRYELLNMRVKEGKFVSKTTQSLFSHKGSGLVKRSVDGRRAYVLWTYRDHLGARRDSISVLDVSQVHVRKLLEFPVADSPKEFLVSPEGRRFLVASSDGRKIVLRIYDARNPKRASVFCVIPDWADSISFAPLGHEGLRLDTFTRTGINSVQNGEYYVDWPWGKGSARRHPYYKSPPKRFSRFLADPHWLLGRVDLGKLLRPYRGDPLAAACKIGKGSALLLGQAGGIYSCNPSDPASLKLIYKIKPDPEDKNVRDSWFYFMTSSVDKRYLAVFRRVYWAGNTRSDLLTFEVQKGRGGVVLNPVQVFKWVPSESAIFPD